jgi:transcriptional regulator GlxA family with amidase domain
MTPKRIGFVGFDGVTASHLAGPADTFSAAVLGDGYGNRILCYHIYTIGLTREPFRAESGMLFKPEETLHTVPELDTIVVPGGEGLRQAAINEKISDWILERANRSRRIAAICTGIYALAPTGLLDGREVTTHWRHASDVARRFPNLRVDTRRPLVKDGAFYTSSGLSAAVDLSLALIEEDYGRHVALATAQEIVMPPINGNRKEWVSKMAVFDSQPTDRFAELVPWIMRNLNQDLSVQVLARRACICPNHFSKVFKSVFGEPPSEFVQNLRLNEARRRLSKRQNTLRTISESVGFTSSAAFQRAFERKFGSRPNGYLEDRQPPRTKVSNGSNGCGHPKEIDETQSPAVEVALLEPVGATSGKRKQDI